MGGALNLFKVRGIQVRMHITFPLILIWAAIQFGIISRQGLTGAIFGVIVTLLLFAIVVLHELGHSFAALRYDVPVEEIVLLPIGGVAKLARIPENPRQEFIIAIAGPLVNFVLAAVLVVLGVALGPLLGFSFSPVMEFGFGDLSLTAVFNYIFVSNLFLGLFNLLPAFPMDGGRVLRALLATRIPYARATSIAVSIGQALAWVLGLWGFLQGAIFVILIAFFIYMGAGQEQRQTRLRSVLGTMTVDQIYSRGPQVLSPESTLQDAVNLTLNSFQSNFPVCTDNRYVGLLTHTRLIEALQNNGPEVPVGNVMAREIEPVRPLDAVFDVQLRMAELRIDALPVAENEELLGLITSQDINEAFRLKSSEPDVFVTAEF